MTGGALRAATWNIHELARGAGRGAPPAARFLHAVRDTRADVLFLQEVPFDAAGRSAALDLLTSLTNLRHASGFPLSRSFHDPDSRSGVAVLTRRPHGAAARIALPNPELRLRTAAGEKTSWAKGMLVATTHHAGGTLSLGSVHSYPFHVFRRDAAEDDFAPLWRALARTLDNLPTRWTLIGGDFNSDDRDLLFRQLTRRRLAGANHGIATHEGRAFDDIVHDEDVRSDGFGATPGFSDHALCAADFMFEGEAT